MFNKEEKGLRDAYLNKVGKEPEEKKTIFEKQRNDKQSMLDAMDEVAKKQEDFKQATSK